MKPVPRHELIREQSDRLLKELRNNTVNDPVHYANHERIPLEVDIMTDEFNNARKWDTCELCLSDLMKRLRIPKKLIVECVMQLESEGLVKMMAGGEWWKVMIDKTAK